MCIDVHAPTPHSSPPGHVFHSHEFRRCAAGAGARFHRTAGHCRFNSTARRAMAGKLVNVHNPNLGAPRDHTRSRSTVQGPRSKHGVLSQAPNLGAPQASSHRTRPPTARCTQPTSPQKRERTRTCHIRQVGRREAPYMVVVSFGAGGIWAALAEFGRPKCTRADNVRVRACACACARPHAATRVGPHGSHGSKVQGPRWPWAVGAARTWAAPVLRARRPRRRAARRG